jgi:2-polyprenyl-3-methyl-5-hydroxy-6-metoxy-1,4-benzoquinol methylase
MESPITGTKMQVAYNIDGVTYYKDETGSLFCGCLDQSNMVGGTGNREENHGYRAGLIGNKSVLDYGCGRGDFIDFLNNQEIKADGYDPYSDRYKDLPNKKYDVVTMIEVIEHTCSPYKELDEIKSFLNHNGIVFIETSFSNWVTPGHPYLNPKIGHSTIFSHDGLNCLMKSKGFKIGNHINQNIRIFEI